MRFQLNVLVYISRIFSTGKPTVTTTQSIVSTDFGKEVTLRCIVNATPKITKIYWYKKINSQSHVTFIYAGFPGMSGSTVETPSLTIKSGTPANNGTYSCVAENIVGITGSEPVILIVRAGNYFHRYNVTQTQINFVETLFEKNKQC